MNISSEIIFNNGSNSSSSLGFNTGGPGLKHWFLYSIICAASVLLGFPTNSYVIWLIVTGTGNGLAAEIFSLNLSVCEIIYSLNSFFELLSSTVSGLSNAVTFFQGIATTGRPLFQCLICVERYLAVIHPMTFLKFKPLRYRVICSVVVWVASFSCYGLTVTFSSTRVKFMRLVFIMTQLIIFLSIQLFCLVAVLKALKQSGPGQKIREEENHMKRRVFIIIRITTVTMVIIYVPYIISLILSFSSSAVTDIISTICFACFALAGLMLPFLFLHRVGKLPFVKRQLQ